ncbi:transglutaminase [Streptomyces goshikiensis]|uniref:transglutaminase n=1 Tax=Streptomyces goshikiensis TaxID=1942 RepID=UPI003826FA42
MEMIQEHPDAAYLAADDVVDHGHPLVRETADALLRARGIPAAFCYQLLADDDGSNAVLHGLIALRRPGAAGWARLDPRGNKPGVDAQFTLDRERLAFPVRPELGELDYPGLYAAPHPAVLTALRGSADRRELWRNLPTGL